MPELGYLNVPPLVEQVDEISCWAAALEAWLSVTPGRKRRSQHELIGVMEEQGRARRGRISEHQERGSAPCPDGRHGAPYGSKTQESPVDWNLSAQQARERGYLFMVYNVFGVGHAVVVYGIVNEPGNETIFAMDPWMGKALYERHRSRLQTGLA